MHEASIAQSIIDIVSRHTNGDGAGRVTRIHVKVGRLTALVPECLDFAFTSLARGTVAEGARLTIEEIDARGRCRACGAVFAVESFFTICEGCGSVDVEITGGEDLSVESVDVET